MEILNWNDWKTQKLCCNSYFRAGTLGNGNKDFEKKIGKSLGLSKFLIISI